MKQCSTLTWAVMLASLGQYPANVFPPKVNGHLPIQSNNFSLPSNKKYNYMANSVALKKNESACFYPLLLIFSVFSRSKEKGLFYICFLLVFYFLLNFRNNINLEKPGKKFLSQPRLFLPVLICLAFELQLF